MLLRLKRLKDILLMMPSILRGGPIWSYVVLTRRCYQFCSHCYEWDNKVPHMSEETYRRVIDKLCDMGVRYVSYYGGEPTLHPQIVDFIHYAKSRKRLVYLNTDLTARHLDDDKLKAIVKAGVDFISFSLDKVEPAKWNKRGISVIDDKLDLLETLRKKGYRFALECSVTFHKDNLAEGQQVVQYILNRSKIGVTFRPALFPIPYGDVKTRTAALLTAQDLPEVEKLMDWIYQKKIQGFPIIVPYQYIRDFSKFLKGGHRWDCTTQQDSLFIEWDGSLLNCSFFVGRETPKPFIPLNLTFENLDKNHWAKVKPIVEHNLSHCNEKCFSSAYLATAYYRHHPWEALLNYFKI